MKRFILNIIKHKSANISLGLKLVLMLTFLGTSWQNTKAQILDPIGLPGDTPLLVVINGPTTVTVNGTYNYTVTSSQVPLNTTWHAIGGSVISSNSTSAQVKWTSTGLRSLSAELTTFGNLGFTTINVQVNSNTLNAGTISGNQTICYGATASTLFNTSQASGGTGTLTYQWQVSSNNSSWTNISGATGSSYSPGGLTATRYYRRRAQRGGQTRYSNVVTVTVRGNLNAGSITGTQTVCPGGIVSFISNGNLPSGGTGSYNYHWQASSDNSNWSIILGANSASYSPGPLSSTQYFRRGAASCNQTRYTSSVKITVTSSLNAGLIGGAKTICPNTSAGTLSNLAAANGGDGNYSYQWQSSANNSHWSNITGATGLTYSPGNVSTDTYFRRRVNSCNQTQFTPSVKINVEGGSAWGGAIGNGGQNICYNETPFSFSNVNAGGSWVGTPSYQWQKRVGNGAWQNIPGATDLSYTSGNLTATTDFRRKLTHDCSPGYSNVVTVTVNPPINGGTIDFVGSTTFCSSEVNQVIVSTALASGGDPFSNEYSWERKEGNGNWETLDFSDSDQYFVQSIATTTQYRRRVLNGCGQGLSNVITLEGGSPLQPGSISATASVICPSNSPGPIWNQVQASGGVGAITYQWQQSSNGTSWNNLTGETSVSLTSLGSHYATRHYRRVATNDCGSVPTAPIVITVSTPSAGSILGEQTICSGEAAAVLENNVTGENEAGGPPSYQWQRRVGTQAWQDIADATNISFDPQNTVEVTTQFRREAISACGSLFSNIITVAVAPPNTSIPSINTAIVYTLDGRRITRSQPPAGEIWYWQGTNPDGRSTAHSEGTFPVNSSGTYYLRSLNDNGCWGPPASKNIIVSIPDPTLAHIISSSSTITIGWTGQGTETSFKVYRSTNASGGFVLISTAAPSDRTYRDTGLVPETTYYYRVQAEKDGELSGSAILRADTNPLPVNNTDLAHVPQFNGNISAIKWKGAHDENEQIYSFHYDAMNRLKSAQYAEGSSTGNSWYTDAGNTAVGGYSVHNINYDLNGNIQSLNRQMMAQDLKTIDELAYSYQGNQLTDVSDNGTEEGFRDGNSTGTDYTYDANGNMVQDLNKGIVAIEYNHLNLPSMVTFEGDKVIKYLYDAAGIKTRQEVFADGLSSPPTKVTDYIGGLVLQNDTIQFLQHQEGRVVLTEKGSWEYQYNLTDHLGNVRMVVSADPGEEILLATMENDNETVAREEAQFLNMDHRVDLLSSPPAVSGTYMAAVNNVNIVGPATLVKVYPGDTVYLEAHSFFEAGAGNNGAVEPGALGGQLLSTVNQVAALSEGAAQASANLEVALLGVGFNGNPNDQWPDAFLNYVFVDEDFNLDITGPHPLGYQQVTNTPGVTQKVAIDLPIVIEKEGYIFSYLTNESNSTEAVYFDDFKVTVKKGPIVQSTDYYPFGAPHDNNLNRDSSPENRFTYNGKEMQNDLGLNLHDYGARFYDPWVSIFTTIDPKSEEYNLQSPYVYASNNPIRFIDQNGEGPEDGIFGNLVKKATNFVVNRAREAAISTGRALIEDAKEFSKSLEVSFFGKGEVGVSTGGQAALKGKGFGTNVNGSNVEIFSLSVEADKNGVVPDGNFLLKDNNVKTAAGISGGAVVEAGIKSERMINNKTGELVSEKSEGGVIVGIPALKVVGITAKVEQEENQNSRTTTGKFAGTAGFTAGVGMVLDVNVEIGLKISHTEEK